MRTTMTTPALTMTTAPTLPQLQTWWQEMHADPDDLRVAFSDFSAKDLATFLRQDLVLVMCHCEEALAATGWLHDLTRDADGTVIEGWIGGWVAKPYRGHIGMACWQLVMDYFLERGIAHIHSAIHVANRTSFVFTRRMMGFTSIGVFPRFSQFGGVRTDVHILTLSPEDRQRAWHAAETMAHRRWPGEYVSSRGRSPVQNA